MRLPDASFDADKLVDVLTMHLHQPPPAIEWTDANRDPVRLKLEAIARQALDKDREKRPQSARDLKTLLLGCRPGGSVDISHLARAPVANTQKETAAASNLKEYLFSTPRRRRTTYAVIFLLLCVLVGHFSEDTTTAAKTPVEKNTAVENMENTSTEAEAVEPSERHSALVQGMMDQLKKENDLLKERLTKLENSRRGEDDQSDDDQPQPEATDSKTITGVIQR